MVRINLQLFAKYNTGTSIVDYLKSKGQDSSYSARKKLASQYGISNYEGTPNQNTQLLNALRNSSASSGKTNTTKTSDKKKSTKKKSNTSGNSEVTAISGVDQSLVDKANSTYTQSKNVTNAQTEADANKSRYENLASMTDIIDQKTWDTLNSSFETSDAYNQAMAYTNSLLEQLSSGRTSYTDQIKDLMGQIQNREDFSYDADTDTLFQQALSSAMSSGRTAMQDTIGQASALTGGYGSTYATSAGNQAYNAYIEDAYNNLPEYYQMAMEAYQMEGQEMYNQLAMLNEADATEFQRMYDSWNANFSNAQQMYAQEYGAWQDSVSNAYNSANLQLNEYGMAVDNAYNMYMASQSRADTLYAQEYQKWADEIANAMQYMNMQNTDYWNTKNFDESQRQYNESLAEQKKQHKDEMSYKYSALAQDQEQFKETMEYNKSKNSGNNSGDDIDLKEPTETQMEKAIEAYDTGGDDSLEKYLESLPSDVDIDEIIDYVLSYGVKPDLSINGGISQSKDKQDYYKSLRN